MESGGLGPGGWSRGLELVVGVRGVGVGRYSWFEITLKVL